jgi:DUF4097 and DUF4098 domain-containing protein YvlB
VGHLKRSKQIIGLLGMVAILTPLSLAQETKTWREGGGWTEMLTGSLAGVKNLRVKLDMGSVVVRGAKQDGIHYTLHMHSRNSSEEDARHQFQAYKVSAYVKGDTAWVVGEWQGSHSVHVGGARLTIDTGSERKLSSEFEIDLPRAMGLVRIDTGGGNIDTTGVDGRVEAESGGGSLHLDDIGGGVKADTGGGSIQVGTITGDIGLQTGGGSIQVNRANGRLVAETGGGSVEIMSASQGGRIETGGGSINVRQCGGNIKVSTGGGNIDLGDIGGAADIQTGGGTIHLGSAKGPVDARTGGGGIELYGVPSARVETGAGGKLETSAGDITVYLAPDVALSVRASVDMGNGHRITSDFPDIHVASEGDQWGPRTLNAEGKLNGGGPVLKVKTTTGDICFRRAQ